MGHEVSLHKWVAGAPRVSQRHHYDSRYHAVGPDVAVDSCLTLKISSCYEPRIGRLNRQVLTTVGELCAHPRAKQERRGEDGVNIERAGLRVNTQFVVSCLIPEEEKPAGGKGAGRRKGWRCEDDQQHKRHNRGGDLSQSIITPNHAMLRAYVITVTASRTGYGTGRFRLSGGSDGS